MATTKKAATQRAKSAKSAASDAASDISADIQSLRDDVDELLQHIGSFAKAEKDAGVDVVNSTREKALEQGEEAIDRSKEYIRENPLLACAAALGAGFVAATLMRR